MLALIRAAERACVAAMEQKLRDEMLRRAADIDELDRKLRAAFGVLLSSAAPQAAQTVAAAMAQEAQLCVALTAALSRPPMQLIAAYEEVDAIVQTVLAKGITTVHLAGRRSGLVVFGLHTLHTNQFLSCLLWMSVQFFCGLSGECGSCAG